MGNFGKYFDFSEKAAGVEGSGVFTDSGMETWTDVNTLTNWGDIAAPGSTGGIAQESVIIHGGTYSCKITTDGTYILYQSKTGLTPGDAYVVNGYYYSADEGDVAVIITNGDISSFTQTWNYVTQEWDTSTDLDNDEYWDVVTGDASWQEYNSPTYITAPANGNITVNIVNDAYEVSTDVYVDDWDLISYTPGDAVAAFDFESTLDATDLLKGDYFILLHTTGGTPKNILSLDYNNMFSTTANWLGCDKDFLVPTTRNYYNSALNSMTGICKISSPAINVKSTGNIQISSEVENRAFVVTQVIIETLTADTLTGDATISIGSNASDFNNIFGTSDLDYSTTEETYTSISPTKSSTCAIAPEEIWVKVATADSGTSGTIRIHLLGFYIVD